MASVKEIEAFVTISSGDGSGYGYGYGYGDGIKEFNGKKIYRIDGVCTIIFAVRRNVAKGYIVKNDMTLKPCYVVKDNNIFAHGLNLRDAIESLEVKRYSQMNTSEVIDEFFSIFKLNIKYPAKDFFIWHNRLTGSCELGRTTFAENHGIDVENDTMTVKQFITLTENAYGGTVIKELKEKYKL